MKLKEIGEFGFIDRIKSGCLIRAENVIKAIGDDCCVFRTTAGLVSLLTTDMLVEDIHFLKNQVPPFKLGRKSLAVNISDIAAMGGIPREAVISIAIPPALDVEYFDLLYDGMKSMASEYAVNLLGGDTTASPSHLVINVALIGEVSEDEIIYRSGAKIGDDIFLTGHVGEAAAGLDIILNNHTPAPWQALLDSQLDPTPQIKAGRIIAGLKVANSMIDISDGVASDLGHICAESKVGAIIDEGKMPVTTQFIDYIEKYNLDFESLSMHIGEDYILLGTVPERYSGLLESKLKAAKCEFFKIGTIAGGRGIKLRKKDGTIKELCPVGYDHFKKEGE
jgi:thiamine-monophosphate kinase